MTIKNADFEGKWPKTVARYVLTNYIAMGNSPAWVVSIYNNLISMMSESEKQSWGFPVKV